MNPSSLELRPFRRKRGAISAEGHLGGSKQESRINNNNLLLLKKEDMALLTTCANSEAIEAGWFGPAAKPTGLRNLNGSKDRVSQISQEKQSDTHR